MPRQSIGIRSSLRTSRERCTDRVLSILYVARKSDQTRSIPHAAPHLCRIDTLVRIQLLRLVQQDIRRFGIGRIRNAAIVDRTDRRALRFVKMADTLGAAVMRNDVNGISFALA